MGNTLHDEILGDIEYIREEMGYPVFTWQSADYPCIASISQFTKELVTGGFSAGYLITMTVPVYDCDGNYTFPNNVLPAPQNLINFNGNTYRIQSVRQDTVFDHSNSSQTSTSGARIRIIGYGTTQGFR